MQKFWFLVLTIALTFSTIRLEAKSHKHAPSLATWGAYLVLGLDMKEAPKLSRLSNDVSLPVFFHVALGVGDKKEITFIKISKRKAKKFHINPSELENYNSDVKRLNNMLDEVLVDLSDMSSPNLHDAAVKWREHKSHLSNDTVSVIHKIGSKR